MKKLMMIVALFVSAMSMHAQEYAISSNKLLDNTYIGIGGVAMTPLNVDHVTPLNGGVELKLGKDLTPIFGFNVEGIALFGSNNFSFSKKNVKATNVGLNGTINITNLFKKYNPNRVFTLSAEPGFGWLHYFDGIYDGQPIRNELMNNDENDLYAKTGAIFNFNVKHGWNLYFEPMILWDLTGHSTWEHCFDKTRALMGLQAGVVYHFNTSNGTHYFKKYNITSMNNEINTLRNELAQKPKTITNTIVKHDTVFIENTYIVTFAQNSSKLTESAKNVLNSIPEGVKVSVKGYASPEGNKMYNMNLSALRAIKVAEYLKSHNVIVGSFSGEGAENTESNRVAIVTIK